MTDDNITILSEPMSRYRPVGPTPRERHDAKYAEFLKNARRVIEVGIPMRDGTLLAADIYLPDESQLPAPAIININNWYDKSTEFKLISPITGKPEPHHTGYFFAWREPELYRDNGYVFVINDERGRGKSEGGPSDVMKAGLPGPYGDGPDGYDLIEWVARQPWCTGRVGLTGGSMLGSSQYTAAFERPPHLTAIMPIAAGGLWLTERGWENGCYHLFGNVSMAIRTHGRLMHNIELATTDWEPLLTQLPVQKIIDQVNHPPTTEVLKHDTLDDWWKPRMLDGKRSEIAVPALHVAGWVDPAQTYGMLKGYEWAREGAAADQQWLIVGPWPHADAIYFPGHVYEGIDYGKDAAIELDQIKMDWFGHWLRGDETWSDMPKVQLFETGSNVWRSHESWPLPGHDESLYFSGANGGALTAQSPTSSSTLSYRYDPTDPVMPAPWDGDLGHETMDQAYLEGRHDVLRYTTMPLTEEVAASGWPRLKFYASSDCDDTEWHVRLTDVHPGGRAIAVAFGCLRASHRNSLSQPSPLVPGEIHEFNLELTPVTHAFLKGHSIRVTITSSNFPTYARSLNRFGPYATLEDPRVALNTLHHTPEAPSQIVLPVTRGTLPA